MKHLIKLVAIILVNIAITVSVFGQTYEGKVEFPKMNPQTGRNLIDECPITGNIIAAGRVDDNGISYAGSSISQWTSCVMVSSASGTEEFVIQYTNATGTNLQRIQAVKYCSNGDILVILNFRDQVIVHGTTYTSEGGAPYDNLLMMVYDSLGTHLSTTQLGGNNHVLGYDINRAPNGNYYITLHINGNLTLNGTQIVANTLSNMLVLLSLDSTLAYDWHYLTGHGGTSYNMDGYSTKSDASSNRYDCFTLQGSNISLGNGISKSSYGSEDWIISKYSAAGVCQSAFQIGGVPADDEDGYIDIRGNDTVFFALRCNSTANMHINHADGTSYATTSTSGIPGNTIIYGWLDFNSGLVISAGKITYYAGAVRPVAIIGDTAYFFSNEGATCSDVFGNGSVTFPTGVGDCLIKVGLNSQGTLVHGYSASSDELYGVLSDQDDGKLFVGIRGHSGMDLDPGPGTVTLSSSKRGVVKYDCNPPVFPSVVTQPVDTEGCVNDALFVEVIATETDTYQWYMIGSGAVSGATDSILWFDPAVLADDGDYFCELTNVAGSINTDTVTVTVNSLPTPTITGDTVICDGTTGTLDAGSFSSYLWNTGETTQTIDVTTAGTYSVDVTNSNGCEGFDDVSVVVNPLPTPTITGTLSFCDGDSTLLDAGSYTSYLWSTGDTTQTIYVAVAGTYSVTVTNSNGCDGDDSVVVTMNPLPTPTISGDDELCEGTDGTYTTGSFSSYAWSIDPSSAGTIVSGQGTGTLVVNWVDSGDVLLDVTNANGCGGSTSFAVTVNELPTADAGVDQSISYGSSTTLDGSATGGDGTYTYAWTPANMVVDPADPQTATVSLTAPQTFTLEVTDGNACVSVTDDVFIDVTGGPLGLNPDVTPEATCGNTQVQLSANAYGGSESYTYSWTSDPVGFTSTEENPVDTPTETITYICEVNDGNTTETGDVTVTVYGAVVADAGPDMGLELGQSTQFDGSYVGGSSDVTISWEGVNNSIPIDDPTILNPNAGPFSDIDVYYFTLTVTDNITGCESIDTMFVDVIEGIDEADISNKIKIYPNPTDGSITIAGFDNIGKVTISNINGQILRSFQFSGLNNTESINLSELPKGLYVAKILSNGQLNTYKIQKR